MENYSDKELKKILDKLNEGKIFCGIDTHNRGIGIIYKVHNDYYNKDYVGYTHYGSSATKFTVDGLRFILEVIFKECLEITEAYYSDYYVNYVPIDTKYEAVDLNRKHEEEYI